MPGQAELLEVRPHRFGGDARFAQRGDGRALCAFRELLPVVAEDQPVVEVLRRGRPESLVQAPVDGLVRPVVVATDHVGDAEVAVVDHAGELVGGGAVVADERDAVEPRHPELLRRCTVSLATLRLAHRPLVPLHAQPLQVVENRLLAARHVPGRVGVVDPQQQPVAEAAVGDRRQRVPDVQRAGRARREANALGGCGLSAGHDTASMALRAGDSCSAVVRLRRRVDLRRRADRDQYDDDRPHGREPSRSVHKKFELGTIAAPAGGASPGIVAFEGGGKAPHPGWGIGF